MTTPAPEIVPPASDDYYAGAYGRILRAMLAVGIGATIGIGIRFGPAVALGFVVGAAISSLNFYWLKRVVSAIADRVTNTGKKESTRGVVLRFLLRYVLAGLAAYVIFRISLASVYGLLAGLALPVAGIFCEAGYELYMAFRHGF